MVDLKPCPFCGSPAEIIDIDEGENKGGSCVSCTRCFASSNVEFNFKENLVSNWNRRAETAEAQLAKAKAENELLREVLANMIGHARWVTDEFDAYLAYLTECEATLTTTGAAHE